MTQPAPPKPPQDPPIPSEGKRRRGRPKGSKNKRTLESQRAVIAAEERERILREQDELRVDQALVAAKAAGTKLMKEIGFDMAHLFAGMARLHAPWAWVVGPDGNLVLDASGKPKNANPNYDEAKFREYAVLAKDTALGAAPFESPRFSAMLVGATTINKVEVSGGMPDDFAAPASIPAAALPAGTIIEAEEDYVSPVAAA